MKYDIENINALAQPLLCLPHPPGSRHMSVMGPVLSAEDPTTFLAPAALKEAFRAVGVGPETPVSQSSFTHALCISMFSTRPHTHALFHASCATCVH